MEFCLRCVLRHQTGKPLSIMEKKIYMTALAPYAVIFSALYLSIALIKHEEQVFSNEFLPFLLVLNKCVKLKIDDPI